MRVSNNLKYKLRKMILMKKFRIFILVVGLCGNWIHPSQTQTLKCASYKTVKTCDNDTATPNCGVDTYFGRPNGCEEATVCPDTTTAEVSCQDDKSTCCCKATANEACNDLENNQALKEKACKLKKLEGLALCAPELTCHDDSDIPMTKKCKSGFLCGADKNGKMMGCIDPADCPDKQTPKVMCTNAPRCCCNADNCNTRAKVCEATKAADCSPEPGPTPTGGPTSAAVLPVSVGSLVCIMVTVRLSNE